MIEYRPAQRIWHVGDGVQITHPRGAAAADWWDPTGAGLGIWAAYQPKGAASYAASLTDLSGNGNNATTGVQPGWNATNGWQFNGGTHYVATAFVAQNDQSQTMITQFTNAVYGGAVVYLAGGRTFAVDRFYLGGTNANVYYGNGGLGATGPTLTAGNICVTDDEGYRNGVAEVGPLGAYGAVPSIPVWIGGLNQSNALTSPLAYYCQAFALYDTILTVGQVAAVAAAMALL